MHGRKSRILFVLGGARSGKSRFALSVAGESFRHPLFIATAEACDVEMADRIARHRKERGPEWECAEAPLDIAAAIRDAGAGRDGIILDCLAVWAGNVLFREDEASFQRRGAELMEALRDSRHNIVVVSNEVGLGLVPEYPLGRLFRDLAGRLNQEIAAAADAVAFVVAGIPMFIKGGRNWMEVER